MKTLIQKTRDALSLSPAFRDERGLTTVEYVIILMLIAVLSVGIWKTFGASVTTQVTNATTAVDGLNSTK